MEYDELAELLFTEIKPKLENHSGLPIFAQHRAKFEGWLKVEVCESLLKHFDDVIPERERVDVSFEDWRIELKTVNTNIRYEGVENKIRPITKNTQDVIEDIDKLNRFHSGNKAIFFMVFPITEDNKNWKIQLERIKEKLKDIKACSFKFKNDVPGVIYFGFVDKNLPTKTNLLSQLEILKKRKEEESKRIETDKIVILERKQANTNNPAIAQLWIKFPASIEPPDDILDYYRDRKEKYSINANVHKITKLDAFEYVLELRGVLVMYTWMEYFINSFKRDYGKKGKGYNIEVRGQWDKYGDTV